MFCQQGADPFDAGDGTFLEAPVAKRALHRAANRLPCVVAYPPMDASVRNDLHVLVGEQNVDEHATILFGVPDAQTAEDVERAFARRLSAKDLG